MKKLETIEKEYSECVEKKKAIQAQIDALTQAKHTLLFSKDFPIGKQIDHKGNKYIVGGYGSVFNNPSVWFNKVKKDGSVQSQAHNLYYSNINGEDK